MVAARDDLTNGRRKYGRRTSRPYKWSVCVGSWRAATIIVALSIHIK
jgi:hypothetical protein